MNDTVTVTLTREEAQDVLTAVDAHRRCIVGGYRWHRLRLALDTPPEKVAGRHEPGTGA